jgi:hypothetical protein
MTRGLLDSSVATMMHAVRTLSTEMLALSLDVACMASAYLIGHSTLVLTDLAEKAVEYRTRLIASATRVHAVARLVHGLN